MLPLLQNHRDREDGFTLVELLIVVLIIGVLAAIAIPVYLGIQNQAHKTTIKQDVNSTVKRVQVALTEGVTSSNIKSNNYPYVQASDKGEVVAIQDSTTAGATANDFMVIGTESTTGTPKGSVDYTYTYDSVTGKFTDSNTANDVVLGGGTSTATVPVITTATLPGGTVGTSYSQVLAVSGQPTPTFALASGSLPTGLNLNTATGAITGTPTTAGSYTFGITATNVAGTSQAKTYTVSVTQSPTITTAGTTLPAATVGTAYSQQITATGTPNPTFTATGLPASLTINSSTGVISGTPVDSEGAQDYTVTVKADNGIGTAATKTYTLTVNAVAPVITTTSLPDATIGTAYSYQLTSTGGTGATTWSASNMPSGMGWNSATGVLNGTPTGSPNLWNVTLTATASGKSSSVTLQLRVVQTVAITNASAEDSSNPSYTWSDYCGGNVSFTSAYAHTGSKSFSNSTVSGNCSEGIIAWGRGTFANGTRVTLTAWVSGSNGTQWTVGGRTDPYNEGFVDTRITTTGLGNWQKVTVTFNAYPQSGSSMTAVGIQVHQIVSPSVAGDTLLMDDVTLTVG